MTDFIKAAARPALSVLFGITIAIAVLNSIVLPEWFLGLAIPTITWWFAERAITHVKANNSASIDKLADKVAEKIRG